MQQNKEPLLAAKAVYKWQQPQCGCLFLPAQQSPMLEPKNRRDFFPPLSRFQPQHFRLKTLAVNYTNHRAIKETNGVAWQNCGLYPSQVSLGICCRVGTKFRQDRGQEGKGDQCCGRPLRSTLQPALVHQGVTEGHYLPNNKTQRLNTAYGGQTWEKLKFAVSEITDSFDIAHWVAPQLHYEVPNA